MSPVAPEGGHGWVVVAAGAALYLLNGIIFFLQGKNGIGMNKLMMQQ